MTTAPKKRKPSEWLGELDSHGIYDSRALMARYELETGQKAPGWPEHFPAETRQHIKARGLGGEMKTDTPELQLQAYGWEIARALEAALVPKSQQLSHVVEGRGSAYRLCVEALQRMGK
jgi:hypothetical protein